MNWTQEPLQSPGSDWGISNRAATVHSTVLIWDNHAGFSPFPDLDLAFLERWLRAGASYLSINVGFDVVMSWDQTLNCAVHYRRWLELHPSMFVLANHVSDVERAKREGKLAVAFDIEGADALNGNLEMISLYYLVGVRHMNLAYNKNNQFAGGCMDQDIALTRLGRDAIAEMNRVGMVVDCSHTGYRSSMEIMELSTKPVVFSHSNPRSLWDHARNIRDDQIKACARTGGVIGIVSASAFLGSEDFPSAMVRHINYIVDLVGVRHVGLGLDSVLDPDELPKLFKRYPQAWPGVSIEEQQQKKFGLPEILPRITEELLRNGYTQSDIAAIMGENFMRVASEVWQ